MTGDFWVLRTDLMKAQCMAALEAVEANHNKPVSVQIKTHSQKRSEAQNRLSHLWYK